VKKPRDFGLPPGPNPHANDPLHVAPFGKVWALVESLGVISTWRTREEADSALATEIERRAAQKAQAPAGRNENDSSPA
jgi:hypothetical protein